MIRSLQLGEHGEERARHLLNVYDLTNFFQPCLITTPHDEALNELRRRLAEEADALYHWNVDEELPQRLRQLMMDPPQGIRPVIWLQQRQFNADDWRSFLILLQRQRDLYHDELPWMWVLAGPPKLITLMQERASHVVSGLAVHILIDEAPKPLPPKVESFRWLHLSDFHFEGLQRWHRRKTLNALLKYAENLRKEDKVPNFVFITGDIANRGKHKDYDQAERFFLKLAEALELDHRNRFFFVPGNHDVDRSAIGSADRYILNALQDQNAIEDVLNDSEAMDLLGRRLEGFYAFTERFLGPARAWRRDKPWRVEERQVGDLRIALILLNSAWASGENDDADGLLIGEAQAREALTEAADAHVRIALVHHPVADLRDFDREVFEQLLISAGVHFVLRGHLHRNDTTKIESPDGSVFQLAAGATYVDGSYPKRFLNTQVDPLNGKAHVQYWRLGDSGDFWAPDTMTYAHAENGVWTVPLPESLNFGNEENVQTPATEWTEARQVTATTRYRNAAAAVHGNVRFIGFSDSRPRRHVMIQELFVPLSLKPKESFPKEDREDDENVSTAQLLNHLLANLGEKGSARVVVLGDPGSGKTTLCRFATTVLAGEYKLKGVDVPDNVLPLFIPFREYVREKKERSLAKFLEERAQTQLQLSLPNDYLENVLLNGNAVLLLDGLDEVGSAGEREEMRNSVQAFFLAYPKVPALVTSRIAGYDEAPLAEMGPDACGHLTLVPFSDKELNQFVSHWYEVQEPLDPKARDQGIADLTAAIEASPPVRALASNPMLATLIALVHRYEAHLPGERATLYDLCVKMLLETWPESRKTTFREIDSGLQRAYLEALAYRMQLQRSQQDDVTIQRDTLISWLTEIIQEREGESRGAEKTRGIVERWVDFLEKGSGLILEQSPGVFAFFHLSLMEYLAAQGMGSAGKTEENIAKRHGEQGWREVCLLAVGSRATDKAFLDRLFKRLSEQSDWYFLFLGMREEAAFDDSQREAILREMARYCLDPWRRDVAQTFTNIRRFSIRHAKWTSNWVHESLSSATGEDLQGLALLNANADETIQGLDQRQDAAEIAGLFLDFWPSHPAGKWAIKTINPKSAFQACQKSAAEILVARTLYLDQDSDVLGPGLVVQHLRWSSSVQRFSKLARKALLKESRSEEKRGLPSAIQIVQSSQLLVASPVPADFFTDASDDFASYFASEIARDFASYFARYFASDFALRPLANLDKNFSSPVSQEQPLDVEAWRKAETVEQGKEFKDLAAQPFARLTAEAWLGIVTTHQEDRNKRLAYTHYRTQNAWLLQIWNAVDKKFSQTNSPDLEALYYTLGFTQATTTWQWPATERWCGLLGGDPPSHWLPRSQWHLCWLLYDSNDDAHRSGLMAALDEGLVDEERPLAAAAMKEMIRF